MSNITIDDKVIVMQSGVRIEVEEPVQQEDGSYVAEAITRIHGFFRDTLCEARVFYDANKKFVNYEEI